MPRIGALASLLASMSTELADDVSYILKISLEDFEKEWKKALPSYRDNINYISPWSITYAREVIFTGPMENAYVTSIDGYGNIFSKLGAETVPSC